MMGTPPVSDDMALLGTQAAKVIGDRLAAFCVPGSANMYLHVIAQLTANMKI